MFFACQGAEQCRRVMLQTKKNILYLVQSKSPPVFVTYHHNGEENPGKTGDVWKALQKRCKMPPNRAL